MTNDPDRLYDLIPVVYRLRDADQGYPLRALLRVIGEQARLLEKDIAGLYENWFIETCADWVVPYIGALVGYTPVSTGVQTSVSLRAQARERITVPRREVAKTIHFRRRKGTLAVLEELAQAVASWPARAVEFYKLLSVTQNIDYLHLDRGRTAELRDGDALDAIGTAFDELARTVDVRRVNSTRARGTANIPEVGVFVWRLRAYTVTAAPAYWYEEESPNCFLFSALGNDVQLFVNPEADGADPALPLPIRRRALEKREVSEASGAVVAGVPFYYGPGKSLMIWTGSPLVAVDPSRIVPADLSDWTYLPTGDQVALDPELGRIVFAPGQTRRQTVWVSYAYGFSADLGGGEYPRTITQPLGATTYRVGPASAGGQYARVGDALARWRQDAPTGAVIEIVDSGVYAEPVAVDLTDGQTLELRAANGKRPVLRLLDWQTVETGEFSIGGTGGWFVLDGVVVTGRGIQLNGAVSGLTIRHATLVPGWDLECDCQAKHPTEPSLEVTGSPRCVTIEHSILGSIQVERDEAKDDPLRIHLSDSILDANGRERVALGASGKRCADVRLTLRRCTIVGQIQTLVVDLAENSIVLGQMLACRRQVGCVRFSYVSTGSRTPRRFECQPDLVSRAVDDLLASGEVTPAEHDAILRSERLRVEPAFDSLRYGTPDYGRLSVAAAAEITTGADDTSEMGVFHDLYQPQRVANLRQRLDEYTPAGADVGIIYAS